ncbi:MAG: hypothetical protein HYX67_02880 [Candidatus Melainabacteria bacterium]|nr:hypothetical protein [Candidatus Melainabacteria bacterium]
MSETKRAVKLGALLVGLEFITQQELVAIMDMANQVGMPLGRALVLSGKITDAELNIALQLHALMRTSDVTMETAKKTFSLVCYQGMPLIDALQRTGWTPSVNLPKETIQLGTLLLEAEMISEDQLREAQETSHKLGLPLGRILTLMGLVSHPVIVRVVDLQSMIRMGRLSQEEAIEYLKDDSRPHPEAPNPESTSPPLAQEESQPQSPEQLQEKQSAAVTKPKSKHLIAAEDPNKRNIRLGELLILAGILTDSDMMNAVELSLTREEPLGAVLIQLGLITTDQLRLALRLQESISLGSIDIQSATDTLLMETGNSLMPKLTDIEPDFTPKRSRLAEQNDAPKLRIGELLKLCGFVLEEEIQSSIALARDYPSVLGRMLVVNGYIDESTLLAALRCQFMVRNKLITIEQAVSAMQYSRQSKLSFDDALDELGFYRHGRLEPV